MDVLPPVNQAVLYELNRPRAVYMQEFSPKAKSPLEGMLAQADSPLASPATGDGKVDYGILIRKIMDVYHADIKDKDLKYLVENSGRIQKDLGNLLDSLRGKLDPQTLLQEHRIALGETFGAYGVILSDARKDLNGAKINYQEAVRLNPDDWGAITNLAALYYRDRDIATAKLLISRAYRIKPDDPVVKDFYNKLKNL